MNTDRTQDYPVTGIKVSQRTANFVKAIEALTAAKDAVLTALQEMYGDQAGEQMYCQMPFEQIEKDLAAYLYCSIDECTADTKGTTI